MNNNIQIINKNGDGMFTEGIAYIGVPSTNKNYIFYTSNEKVDNDLTKIYISETKPDMKVENTITDTEWEDLRKKMIKISHKEEVEDVNFLKMNDVTFNVGEPKKLAITAVAKQAFIDAQLSHTISTNQTETPVTDGNSSTFFSQDAVETPSQTSSQEQSIFANPPQPTVTPEVVPQVEETQVPPMPQEEVVQPMANEVSTSINNQTTEVDMPKQTSSVEPTPAVPLTPNMVTSDGTQPAMPDVSMFTSAPSTESSVVEQVQEISSQPTSNISEDDSTISNTKPIITDEEALKAINTIQEYINQESENNQ